MEPAKLNDKAPRKLGTTARREARRNTKHPIPATHQVATRLNVHAALAGRITKRRVKGYAAPAFQPPSSGAPLQM